MAEPIGEAFVRVRPDTVGFKTALTGQLRGDLQRTERETQRFARGTLVGTGALQGLGRAAAFASTAFIGGAGLVYAIRSSVKEATDQAQILANLRNALTASGFSWREYGARITEATQKTKEISAFDDEQLYKSLQLLIRGTGDVNKALKLNALAADVARGRNLGLVQSAQLLVRVNAGQVGSLRRLGINVKQGISGTEALIQVQKQYAGAAEAFSKTAAGAQARLTVGIQDTEKAIGRALLPTITRLEGRLADWLNKTENQKRVQRDVEAVIRDTSAAVHGLTDAFRILAPPVRTASDALGGVEKTARDLILLFAAWKVGKVIAEFNAIGAAAGEKGAAGQVGLLGTRLTGLRALGEIVIPVTLALSITESSKFKSIFGGVQKGLGRLGFLTAPFEPLTSVYDDFRKAIANVGAFGEKRLTGAQVTQLVGKGQLDGDTLNRLNQAGLLAPGAYKAGVAALRNQGNIFSGQLPAIFSPTRLGGTGRPETGTSVSSVGGALLTRGQRLQQQLANAALTKSTADDLKALTAQSVFLNDQIATESKRLENASTKKEAKKFFDNLQALKGQQASVLGQIQSIEEQDAADAKARADAAARAAAKARRAREAAIRKAAEERKKAREAFLREVHADAQVALEGVGKLGVDTGKLRRAYEARQKAQAAAAKAALTAQETALNIARQAADLAFARAGTNQSLIAKAETLAEKADRALIRFYEKRAKAAKTVADRQAALQAKISAQIDLANLRAQKATQKDSFTLAQLYQEAESEYKLYGSNYGPGGTPLSPQQQRGAFSNIVLKQKGSVNVVQNFFAPTRPSQAMNDARSGARYLN